MGEQKQQQQASKLEAEKGEVKEVERIAAASTQRRQLADRKVGKGKRKQKRECTTHTYMHMQYTHT